MSSAARNTAGNMSDNTIGNYVKRSAAVSNLHEHRFGDQEHLFDAAADQLADCIEKAVATRGFAQLAFSGGKSPEALFRRLAKMVLPWSRLRLTLVDERFVPPDHPDSNERLIRATLLQGPAAAATLVPLYRAGESLDGAAACADHDLRQWPLPFDAVVLGMGEDGHTASWFPDAPELSALLREGNERRVQVAHPQIAPYPRLTLTRDAVLQSRCIQLLIPGAGKAAVYQRARAAAAPITELPVRAVLHQVAVPVHVYCTT